MAIALTSTGKVNSVDFTGLSDLPAWLTKVESGGTVSVGSNVCRVTTENNRAIVRTTSGLPALPSGNLVRVLCMYNSASDSFPNVGVKDSATAPVITTGVRRTDYEPSIDFPATYANEVKTAYGASEAYPTPSHAGAHSVGYVVELYWDDTNVTVCYRNMATMAVIGSYTYAYAYANQRWLTFGTIIDNALGAQTFDISKVIVCGRYIEITGCPTNSAVRLLDSNGVPIFSADSIAGTALLDTFEVGKRPVAVRYSLECIQTDRMCKSWTFEGSNDNFAKFDVLDTQTNAPAWSINEVRSYTFSNIVPYRYYRLNVNENYGDAYLRVGEIQFYDSEENALCAVMTSDSAPAPNAVTASSSYGGGGHLKFNSFDRVGVTGWCTNGINTGWLVYDFGIAHLLDYPTIAADGSFDGSVVLYEDDTYAVELASFAGSDIWGGDEYLMGPLDYGVLKARGGDVWNETRIQYWDGGAWAAPVLKCWDGEGWQEIRQAV